MHYKHTQISYLMIIITLAVLVLFAWAYITTANEPPSVDSGNNLLTTATMVIILFVLASFTSLQVSIDEKYLRIKFGYGIYKRKFSLNNIVSAKTIKNLSIYNIPGFDAVEIQLKNGKSYRIGTDEPKKLEQTILHAMK